MMGVLDEHDMLDFEDGTSKQFELYDNIGEFIQNYEESRKNKKAEKLIPKKGVEKFMEE